VARGKRLGEYSFPKRAVKELIVASFPKYML
jgi:hypothetical protein